MKDVLRLGLLIRAGMKAASEDRLEDAVFQLHMALSMARGMDSPLHEAKVRNNLALVHQLRDDLNAARSELRQALEIVENSVGQDNILYRKIADNLDKAA